MSLIRGTAAAIRDRSASRCRPIRERRSPSPIVGTGLGPGLKGMKTVLVLHRQIRRPGGRVNGEATGSSVAVRLSFDVAVVASRSIGD